MYVCTSETSSAKYFELLEVCPLHKSVGTSVMKDLVKYGGQYLFTSGV